MHINISSLSYAPGDFFQVEVDFEDRTAILGNVRCVNADIFRVDIKRNMFVFGFGQNPRVEHATLIINQQLPETLERGVHFLGAIRLIYDEHRNEALSLVPGRDFPLVFFTIDTEGHSKITEAELAELVEDLSKKRLEFLNESIVTNAAKDTDGKTFSVLVFSVGCLVHHAQDMAGYSINPLKKGYNFNHIHESVNLYLAENFGINLAYDGSIADQFSRSTPLFVIYFKKVCAVDHVDAAQHCQTVSENIFTVLAYEKGQRPNHYATIIISEDNQIWQAFHFPGYSGNLVSDFNPSSTAEMIERVLPQLEKSPWVDLLMRSLGDALSEKNPDFAFLKYWGILECIAKKRIPENSELLRYPDGTQIFYEDGKPVKSKSPLGKVYVLLIRNKIPASNVSLSADEKYIFETYEDAATNPNLDEHTTVFRLWDVLRAAYEIRNAATHSGAFDVVQAGSGSERAKIAGKLYSMSYFFFLDHIRELTRLTVSIELNQTTG